MSEKGLQIQVLNHNLVKVYNSYEKKLSKKLGSIKTFDIIDNVRKYSFKHRENIKNEKDRKSLENKIKNMLKKELI